MNHGITMARYKRKSTGQLYLDKLFAVIETISKYWIKNEIIKRVTK
tara:strand:- start:419 stop:556 length:138 start_codon:yes stop_codon:yes gene_type:complete